MILGEYAVLHGKLAVVSAIDKFIHVTIRPRHDNAIYIDSALGQYHTTIDELHSVEPFEYVLTALALSKPLLSGCDITIDAEFSSQLGLGSSAAVTVAMLTALQLWREQSITRDQLWQSARRIVHAVRGKGSGADLAASIYGGVIAFRQEPFYVEHLSDNLPLCVVYSGQKTPTHRAIDIVQEYREKSSSFSQQWDESMEQLSIQGVQAIKSQNWKSLGSLFQQAQQLMVAMGVSNDSLDSIVHTLQKEPEIFGAKISGSGFGDCVIG